MSVSLVQRDVTEIVSSIRRRIEWLLSNNALYGEISAKGRDIIVENYDTRRWRKMMEKVLCLN